MKITSKFLIYLIAFPIILSSCKDKEEVLVPDVSIEKNIAFLENELDRSLKFIDEAFHEGIVKGDINESVIEVRHNCAKVLFDSTSEIKSLTIDFGLIDCLGRDDRVRSGKLIYTWKGKFHDFNTTHTLQFDNYSVNHNIFNGNSTVTAENKPPLHNNKFKVVEKGKLTMKSGSTFDFDTEKIREYFSGFETPNIWDDIFETSGKAEYVDGKNNKLKGILSFITTSFGCENLTYGSIKISRADGSYNDRFVNYGNNVCDDSLHITVNYKDYKFIID